MFRLLSKEEIIRKYVFIYSLYWTVYNNVVGDFRMRNFIYLYFTLVTAEKNLWMLNWILVIKYKIEEEIYIVLKGKGSID